MRKAQWLAADKFIKANTGLNFTLGHNTMSDWTEAEYEKLQANQTRNFSEEVPENKTEMLEDDSIPGVNASVDWTKLGMVSPVKS